MIYIIGLGLNDRGISLEGIDAVKKCKKVYLESYTIEFPYSAKKLEKTIKKRIISADRGFVESFKILDEAKKSEIALLIYGSPLTATTHTSIVQEAKKRKIKVKVIHSTSILDAIAETGLHLYKFGKITSIPKWGKNFTPTSFIEILKENQKINAHTLILIDIGMEINEALSQLLNSARGKINFGKIIICSRMGTDECEIIYDKIENLKNKKIKKPFCIIIPGELHFTEEEFLERLKNKLF